MEFGLIGGAVLVLIVWWVRASIKETTETTADVFKETAGYLRDEMKHQRNLQQKRHADELAELNAKGLAVKNADD